MASMCRLLFFAVLLTDLQLGVSEGLHATASCPATDVDGQAQCSAPAGARASRTSSLMQVRASTVKSERAQETLDFADADESSLGGDYEPHGGKFVGGGGCPDGTMVTEESECKAAATKLGLPYRPGGVGRDHRGREHQRPGGCYAKRGKEIFFNTVLKNGRSIWGQATGICKKGGAPGPAPSGPAPSGPAPPKQYAPGEVAPAPSGPAPSGPAPPKPVAPAPSGPAPAEPVAPAPSGPTPVGSSKVVLVDLPGLVETFPKNGKRWPIKVAASKTDEDSVYVSWTEQGNTGSGTKIHLSKLSVQGAGKFLKDRSYDGYDRAGGLDTTPDGRVGFLCIKRMERWEKEYFSGKHIGSQASHWATDGKQNGGPMLVAMCELKEADLQDSQPKWLVGNHFLNDGPKGRQYTEWGNYPVNYWAAEAVSGTGEVTFFSEPNAFGDFGASWFVAYGTTIENHQGGMARAISDKKSETGKTCEGVGPKCWPQQLPDGMVTRLTNAALDGAVMGSWRIAHGHPGAKTQAINSAGVMAQCHVGEGRGLECNEIHKVRQCDGRRGKCEEPRDKGFVMTTAPASMGCGEHKGTLLPRPPGKGWVFAFGKQKKVSCTRRGPVDQGNLGPNDAEEVALCVALTGGTEKGQECGGSGLTNGGRWDIKCNKLPRAKVVSPAGQRVNAWNVKGAKLGRGDSDSFLIGWSLQETDENYVVEVDGSCNVKHGPTAVKKPAGMTGSLWGATMQWSTTVSGKVVSVAPGSGGKGAAVFIHECVSC